MNERAIFPLLV